MKKSVFSRRVISVFLSLFLLSGMFYSFGFQESVNAAPPPPASTDYSVTLDGNLTWLRPATLVAYDQIFVTVGLPTVSCSYAVTTFTVETTGGYSIDCTGGSIDDSMFYIYTEIFDPVNPTANFLVGNDDRASGQWLPYIGPSNLQLTAGTQYSVVTTTWGANYLGSVNFTITGPYFDVAYSAGAGGAIQGTSAQLLLAGGSATPVVAAPDPGYHFLNWSDGYPSASRTDTDVQGVIDATANFEPDYYSLHYAAGTYGMITGSADQSVIPHASGSEVVAVPDTGYHFVSWSDGYATAARTDTDVTSNVEATASFAINSYTLTYTAGSNGTLSGNADQTVTHGADAEAVEAVPDTGYHFVKWGDNVLTAARTDTVITSDLEVTAQFEADVFDVSFDSQGGSAVTAVTAPYSTLITAPADPAMTGYTFCGWYKEAACTNVWDFTGDTVTTDTILYAAWTINSYTVTFQDWDGTVLDAQLIIYGDDAVAPEAPLRTGYTFESWNPAFTDVADNTVVEAVYRINPTPTPIPTPTPTPTIAPTAAPTAAPAAAVLGASLTATPATAAVLGAARTGETDNQMGMQIGIILLLAFGAAASVYVIRRKKMKD